MTRQTATNYALSLIPPPFIRSRWVEKALFAPYILLVVSVLLALWYMEAPCMPSETEILLAADRARGNMEGVHWVVKLTSLKNEQLSDMEFDVNARGHDIAGEALSPSKYNGNKVIQISGNMWFYKPGLSKPVPISSRQKLLGNAAYGDIAATNYAQDYEATQVEDVAVDGTECYVFDLKSKDNTGTYDRVLYWVSKDDLLGVKAEYYTVSGKMFKSARMKYDNIVETGEGPRAFISEIQIFDELMTDDITTLRFSNPAIGKLPDYLFNLNLLKR